MASLLNNVLNAMEQVILEVIDSKTGTVRLMEGESQWARDLFPEAKNQQTFIIDDGIPFLHDFLIDSRLIWREQENGRLRSGYWTEVTNNDQELHLEAIAIKQDQHNLLVICNQFEEFKHHQHTKQLARDLLLSNDRLYLQNEYLHTRLLSILKQANEPSNIITALTKVIENAEFAVLVADNNFDSIIENSAALTLFKTKKSEAHTPSASIDIICKLMKNQLPEYERIISTKSSWDGELCWMSPPSTLKWLKIALYPVKNKLNEIENWIIFANDISTVKYLTQRNEQLALQDMLTELPNRYSFWQTLEEHVAASEPFYLLYVDINEFRRHNEFYGHDEGDKLLIEFSKRIKNVIKGTDFIARVCGDEFAIILTNINNRTNCETTINRILTSLKKPFNTKTSESFHISVSIGAANFPQDAQSVEELMKFADLSAYNHNKNNKNSVQFYSTSMIDASHHIIAVEKELRHAIINEEFELYLQPIIDLKNNNINKAEALIRWNHPIKGMIYPDQFIPIAEKTELINVIGEWVIDQVCKISQKTTALGYKIKLSMNLSPYQVSDEHLFTHILSSLKKYSVDPCLLEIEVTEGVLVDDYTVATELLSKARTLGMSVAIDDFGTGYSSLAYLKSLPLDFLKIDRSFIKDIAIDEKDKAIVQAIIAMAHSLNLWVICEGVEVEEQLNFLIKNSCNSAQGYFFSRPVSFNAFIEILNQKKLTK
jgi:diguanylate cyclase (GGDEF)-like protein